MYNESIINDLVRISEDLKPLSSELGHIANVLSTQTRAHVCDDVLSVLRHLESSAVSLRTVASRVASSHSYPLKASFISSHDIEVETETYWIRISMPVIVPGNKSRTSMAFLLRPLREALAEYMRAEGHIRYTDCEIVVEHEYDITKGPPVYVDYDNISVKGVVDVIAARFLTEDSSKLINVHHVAKKGKRDCTNLYIMPRYCFRHWVEARY